MALSLTLPPLRCLFAPLLALKDRFKRKRRWCPRSVAIGVLLLKRGGRRQSYESMLDTMKREFSDTFKWNRTPCEASFSQARSKLTAEVCHELLVAAVAKVDRAAGSRFQHSSGRRLIAIDGTRMVVPRTRSTALRYPRPGYSAGKRAHYPQALTVFAVDVMKRLPLDWVMLRKGRGEREGAIELAQRLQQRDILIVDRGFPGRSFVGDMIERKLDLVVRMTTSQTNAWPEVQAFLAADVDEQTVNVRVGECSVPMRLIRRKFRQGCPKKHQKAQTLVIMTTLLDHQVFPKAEIIRIYTARWGVETLLRELKVGMKVEDFHTRSATGMEQEIAMSLLWIALTSALHHVAEQGLTDGRRVNRTLCAYLAERYLDDLCAGRNPNEHYDEDIEWLRKKAKKHRIDRSFPRYSKSPYGRFNNNMAK
jgi:hypothetical protein